jgi:hypothetical protein
VEGGGEEEEEKEAWYAELVSSWFSLNKLISKLLQQSNELVQKPEHPWPATIGPSLSQATFLQQGTQWIV